MSVDVEKQPPYYDCPDCDAPLRAVANVIGDKEIGGRAHVCDACGTTHEAMDAWDDAWDYDEDAF